MTPHIYELWMSIPGYELKYSVSNKGRIYSHRQKKYLSLINDKDGYKYVNLSVDGVRARKRVHRAVLEAFIGGGGNMHVNHKNGIKDDNRLENLEWCTPLENNNHATLTGLRKHTNIGSRAGGAKLTEPQVLEIRKIKDKSLSDIARLYNVGLTTISYIKNNKTWRHI